MYKLWGWFTTILGTAIICISWGSIEAHDGNLGKMAVYVLAGTGLLTLAVWILESVIKRGGFDE